VYPAEVRNTEFYEGKREFKEIGTILDKIAAELDTDFFNWKEFEKHLPIIYETIPDSKYEWTTPDSKYEIIFVNKLCHSFNG